MHESYEEVPPLPQGDGPGPDLDPTNSELELHTISLSQPELDFVVNTSSHNGPMRTIDHDDCSQPQRRPRLDDVSRDTSTIFSQRSGTDTLDTEPTIQRGSRSKKPSPDDQPTAQPAQVSHSDNNTNHIPCEVTTITTHLSFPSPPSVDDEEVVMQKTSICIQTSLETSVSTTEATHHNNPKNIGHRTTTTAKKSSPTQRFLIILVALVVIVIVIVVVIKVTNGKEDNSQRVQTNHGMVAATPPLPPTTVEPTLPATALTTPAPSEPPPPTTVEDEILLLPGNLTSFNQTDEWIDFNINREEGVSQSPSINLVPAEEEEEHEDFTVSPSLRGAMP